MPKEFKSTFLKTLNERGFIHQCTDFAALDEVRTHLSSSLLLCVTLVSS